MSAYLTAVWEVLVEFAPWLFLGAVVSGLLHKLLPADFMHRNLTGRFAVLKSVIFGIPLPLCSCGVIPAGIGLKKDGASDGASVGFLIATPQTGVDSVMVSASMLGWPFALFKVVAALATGLVGGALTDRFGSRGQDAGPPPHEHTDRTWRGAWDHGVLLIKSIWGWLVFGVLASAAITTLVPETWLTALGSYGGFPAMFAVLLIAVPLYVCATASVPIAAALVAGGMPAGAALVFLMAGPATNLATLGAIKKTFGLRTTGIYLATIVIGSILAGWLFSSVLTSGPDEVLPHEHGDPIWAVASAALLVASLVWFAIEDARRFVNTLGTPSTSSITVGVEGMTCGGCSGRLEKVLNKLEGVDKAVVHLADKKAVVEGAATEADVRKAIEMAGFDPV
ncbi:MAG: hypothetical protein GY884_30620 [Proteobacteria bacterium]|nr:hypothetical protein [Pseudomonadota bacterium]